MLRNGEPAPEFEMRDHMATPTTLGALRDGRPLVLLFSRFAACPTSRRDLLAYGNVLGRLESMGARFAAVTVEPPEVHRHLRSQLGLEFPLLSDDGFRVSERWGVYRSDETDEGPQPHGEPAVFVVDVDGKLAYSQVSSGPKGLANASEIALMVQYMASHGGRYW